MLYCGGMTLSKAKLCTEKVTGLQAGAADQRYALIIGGDKFLAVKIAGV